MGESSKGGLVADEKGVGMTTIDVHITLIDV
jgi:hypothetical protein